MPVKISNLSLLQIKTPNWKYKVTLLLKRFFTKVIRLHGESKKHLITLVTQMR